MQIVDIWLQNQGKALIILMPGIITRKTRLTKGKWGKWGLIRNRNCIKYLKLINFLRGTLETHWLFCCRAAPIGRYPHAFC